MPWKMSSWAAVLAVLSASWTGLAQGMIHQEGSNSSTETCSIPASLSSFQGTYHCNSSVRIVRAGTEEEIAGILQQYNVVNEEGTSYSWLQEQLQLGDNASVVTDINTTLALHNSMPATIGSYVVSSTQMEAFLLGAACALAAAALLWLTAAWASLPKLHIAACGGTILGIIVMGVLAVYIPWDSPGLLAFVASCAWFASPTLAVGIVVLMIQLGCIEEARAKENKSLHAAVRLLPCLASGVVTIVVAQLYKTDLAKGWAAWLQVLVTIGVGWGALLVFICCLEQTQEGSQKEAAAAAAAKEPQGLAPSVKEGKKQEHMSPTAKQLPAASVHSHIAGGNQSSGAVHKQAKAYLLLREWMTERSRHGYSVTGAHEIDGGKYSWVMMSNKGMPITQQTYMVNEELPFKQISEYWKHGFYIRSMVSVGKYWAILMSTNAGFEDQYIKVLRTTPQYESTAIGRKGWFTYNGDVDDFQATACAASMTSTIIATVMSKPVGIARNSSSKPS